MAKGLWILLLAIALTACTTTPESTPTAPEIHSIATTPDLETMVASWLSAYVEASGAAQLHLDVLSPQIIHDAVRSGEIEVAFIAQEPSEGWFATPMVKEAIAIIVNPHIPVESFGIDELATIFAGRVRSWEAFTAIDYEILPVIPYQGDAIRARFAQVVMGEAYFDPSCLLGSTPRTVLDLVGEESGAIGFMPMRQVEAGVNVVAVEGVLPEPGNASEGTYPLWVDVVATSTQEPQGPVREFLGWLQDSYLSETEGGFAD